MNRALIALLACIAWSGLMFAAGWAWRGERSEAAVATEQAATTGQALQQVQDTRATEHKQAGALAEIATEHEEDRRDAEAVPDAVAADLRAGNLRLRHGWAGCETQRLSDAAAAAAERDAGAASREELAGAVVRVGRDADDQLAACQAVIQAYTQGEADVRTD